MERNERVLLLLTLIIGGIVILPIILFILIALWPQRVLVSWLLFGLIALVILLLVASSVIRTVTTAKVRLDEEALRPGRLYTDERLVRDEAPAPHEMETSQASWREDRCQIQLPYSSQEKVVPRSYVSGLPPLHEKHDI